MNDKEALVETTEIEDSELVEEPESNTPDGSESVIPESAPPVGEQPDTDSGAAVPTKPPATGNDSSIPANAGTVSKGDAAGSTGTVSKGDAAESTGTVSKGDAAESTGTVSKGDAAESTGTVSKGDVRGDPVSVVFTDGYDPAVFDELSMQLSDVSANQVLMLESMERQELQNEACISILLIFLVVGVLRYIYKFFGMFFPVS